MGFSDSFALYFSRFIIGAEIFLGIMLLSDNYLKRLILPLSVIMLISFSIHLATQIGMNISNCGCGGDLVKLPPDDSLVKNIATIICLILIYTESKDVRYKFSNLVILFFVITSFMFVVFPASSQSSNTGFLKYIDNDTFVSSQEDKILCLFDAGCDHCKKAARSLDSLSHLVEVFPQVYIIFSDTEEDKIPEFLEFAGEDFLHSGDTNFYQVMPFANYDTEEVDSYMEITFPDYDNPIVILYNGAKQVRLFDGSGKNEFDPVDLRQLLENE